MEFVENLSPEEILLIGILRNPAFFLEFAEFYDGFVSGDITNPRESFRHFKYQERVLLDFNRYVSVRASRSAGKTYTLRSKIVYLLAMAPYGKVPILFTVPNEYHLDPVWDSVITLFRANALLKSFLKSEFRGINVQKHTVTTKFGNQWVCRIAGEGRGGKNVIGLHVAFIAVDEAGYYPWDTFQELQPVLNKDKLTPGAQMIVAGTPSGGREKNVLYYADTSDEYSHHRMNAFMNPFYTEKDHQEDIKKYGGKDSPEYIHFVLGEHGSPSFSLFDRSTMLITSYPVYKLVLDFRNKDFSEEVALVRMQSLPDIDESTQEVVIGIDLGYTDPTAIYIIRKDGYKYKIFAKIKFIRAPYPVQKKLIIYLLNKYSPDWVALDIGHSGLHFYQELLDDESIQYDKDRIIPVNFSSSEVIGVDQEGKELKEKVKNLTVNVLQRLVSDNQLEFSTTDMDTVSDLERFSFTKTASGNIVYYMAGGSGKKTGDGDHFVSALLCFAYGVYLNDSGNLNRKRFRKSVRSLAGARFVA